MTAAGVTSARTGALWTGAVIAALVGIFHIVPVPEYLAQAPTSECSWSVAWHRSPPPSSW